MSDGIPKVALVAHTVLLAVSVGVRDCPEITLFFTEIEKLIHNTLPNSAKKEQLFQFWVRSIF
ncbi:hypothetical protein BLD44_023355 [Mastigocladus laminosus UU774]|nr:hypothetical protein BLD44_023355 [Mastigocladus laminosus UU774]